jgi:hypothetical protein
VNLNQAQLAELNTLLKSTNLDLPSFRREVRSCGTNYEWLQKNLTKRNQNASARLKELLGIKPAKVAATEVEGG